MKLKGSARRIDLKSMFIFTIVSAVTLTAIRTYQMFTIVERGSGFWTGDNFTISLLYALLFLVIGASVFFGFLSAKIPQGFSTKEDPIIGAGALIFAVSILIDGATQLWNFVSISTNWQDYAPTDMDKLSFLLKSSSFALPMQSVFAILSALYFLLFGLYYLNGSRSLDDFKLLAVMPVFWVLMQLIYRFARTTNFMNVSELFFELFLLAAMILFFLNFSRAISHVSEKDSYWRVYAFGIPSVVLGVICSVPRFLLVITGQGGKLTDNSPFTFWYLAGALFIALCLFRLFNEEENALSETASPAEEKVEEVKSEEAETEVVTEEFFVSETKAPVEEKFNADEFFGNTPKKEEPAVVEKEEENSPKVKAPKVEKFSMEALSNNEPSQEYVSEVPAEEQLTEEKTEPHEDLTVSEEKAEVPEEQLSSSEIENSDEHFSLDEFMKLSNLNNKADDAELDRFDLEDFLKKLDSEENKK